MIARPLVSVLVPTYNAGRYLCPSVASILAQTYRDLEVIVIDDGSTDGSVEALTAQVRDPRLRVLCQANGGAASAKNLGLDRMSGAFFAIQDADDISRPQRLERQVRFLQENPGLAGVFVGHELIIAGRSVAPRRRAKAVEECRRDVEGFRMPGHGATPMYRVALVRDLRFEPSLRVAEDVDYILQVGERHPLAVLGECLYSYRVNLNSGSRIDPVGSREMERRAVARACARRGWDPADHLPPPRDPSENHLHRHREQVVAHFMESVLDARRDGHRFTGLRTALACARLHPADLYYYKPLAYALAPFDLIASYQRSKARLAPTLGSQALAVSCERRADVDDGAEDDRYEDIHRSV